MLILFYNFFTKIATLKTDKDIAEYVKLGLDDTLSGPWNVIVGQRFGGLIAYIPSKLSII